VFEHFALLATASIANGERYELKAEVERMLHLVVKSMPSMSRSLEIDSVVNAAFDAAKSLVACAKTSVYVVSKGALSCESQSWS